MQSNKSLKVAIIGGGCAGLTAAIYTARAMLEPIVFADVPEKKGGLLMKTTVVENYPGYPEGIDGHLLINNMEEQAKKYGATILPVSIKSINFSRRPFVLTDNSGIHYKFDSVIICTGSKPVTLGLEYESKYWSNGISSCATCDGFLYRRKKIIVVGGGDSAMEEALYLSKYSNVTIIHRRNQLRASKVMQNRVFNNDKISVLFDTIITSLHGSDVLESVTIKNIVTGVESMMKVDGLFYGLGSKPNSELFSDYLETDDDGYIKKYRKIDGSYKMSTSIEGIFVAGDVSDKKYRQAVVAAGDGCKAAMDVEKYLEDAK